MDKQVLSLIGRLSSFIKSDIDKYDQEISETVVNSRFLVIGGAGSIGQAVTRQIFKRRPLALHIVDINENGLAELVRDIRSTLGYTTEDFKTFCVDIADKEFDLMMQQAIPYDYILNLSAMKHVRSERDMFTLYRMIRVNIFNAIKIFKLAEKYGTKKYFCISTDKATNPVSLMGASKRVMEILLFSKKGNVPVSMARFANVAFSSGSLLDGFVHRFAKKQPMTAPKNILRYFITAEEAGELCLLACLFGEHRDIFFPKLSNDMKLISFVDICKKYLKLQGYDIYYALSEEDARDKINELITQKKWPCYFFESDTTGEKPYEEFYSSDEFVVLDTFQSIGIIKNSQSNLSVDSGEIEAYFQVDDLNKIPSKDEIVRTFKLLIPNFNHVELGKSLEQRM